MYTISIAGHIVNVYKFSGPHFKLMKSILRDRRQASNQRHKDMIHPVSSSQINTTKLHVNWGDYSSKISCKVTNPSIVGPLVVFFMHHIVFLLFMQACIRWKVQKDQL